MTTMERLTLARILLLAGLAVGLLSWRESARHIGSPDFLVPGYEPPTPAWYHVFVRRAATWPRWRCS